MNLPSQLTALIKDGLLIIFSKRSSINIIFCFFTKLVLTGIAIIKI